MTTEKSYSVLSDSRLIYLAIGIIVFTSVLVRIPVPIANPLTTTISFYNELEKLPEESKILICDAMSGITAGDTFPQCEVFYKYLIERNLHPVLLSRNAESVTFMTRLLSRVYGAEWWENPLYGSQIVYLNYVAGDAANLWSIRESLRSVHATDYRGTPLDDLAMDVPDHGSEWDMVMYHAGGGGIGGYPTTLSTAFVEEYGTPFIMIGTTSSPGFTGKLIGGGFLKGLIVGTRGGAEFEALTGIPGDSVKYMSAQVGVVYLVIIGLIILNVKPLLSKPKAEER
jgi:hypothetical protein